MRFAEALSNHDIDEIAALLNIAGYRGTYSRDRIPDLKYNELEWSILNTEEEDQGNGKHWIAIIKKKSDIIYFDSFGIWPIEITHAIAKASNCKNILYQYEQLQGNNNMLCGYYCLMFVLDIIAGKPLKEFDSTNYNDKTAAAFRNSL